MSGPSDNSPQGGTSVRDRPKTRQPERWKVVLLNDDYTTQDFVVTVLKKFFAKSHSEAYHLMLTVHYQGRAIAGVYPHEIAEAKVHQVIRFSRSHGHPLMCEMEPE